MSNQKLAHTPGPWQVGPTGAGAHGADERHIIGEADEVICSVWPMGDDFNIDETPGYPTREANARLIAKAPELLELVRRCEYCHDGGDSFSLQERDRWLETARTLLAEIDGR